MKAIRFFSPFHWVVMVRPYLVWCARRKWLLMYMATEIALELAIGCAFFFLKYLSVVRGNWWVFYVAATTMRLGFAMVGVYGIWTRSLQWTRTYFLLFFLCLGFLAWTMIPVMRLGCRADNFKQSAALTSFSSPGKPFMNQETPPSSRYAWLVSSQLKVVEAPPKLKPLEADEVDALGKVAGAHSLLQQGASSGGRAAAVEAAFAADLRRANATARGEADCHRWARSVLGTSRIIGDVKKLAAQKILNWFRTVSIRKDAVYDTGIVNSFWLAPEDVRLEPIAVEENFDVVAASKCRLDFDDAATPLQSMALRSKLEDLREASWAGRPLRLMDLGSSRVASMLEACFSNRMCSGVFLIVQGSHLAVCEKVGPHKFVEKGPDDTEQFAMTFRRKSTSSLIRNPLYTLDLRDATPEGGMKAIRDALGAGCTCDMQDERNCMRMEATAPIERYWCFVTPDSAKACIAGGTQVFFDEKSKRFWAEDLCSNAGGVKNCACSGLGMLPPSSATVADGISLWPNKLNYGSSCKAWNGDGKRWCFVGYDANCADRTARRHYSQEDSKADKELNRMPLQFTSAIPCLGEEHEEAMLAAQTNCVVFRFVLLAMVALHTICRLLAGASLHFFIENRCTDPLHVEAQFDIVFSSDEEDMSDAPSKRSQRAPGSGEFPAAGSAEA